MKFELFKVRLKQFARILKEIGLIRSIIMLGFITFAIALLNTKIRIEGSRFIFVLIYFFIVTYINFKRKDKFYITLYFSNAYFIFLIKNLVLSIPLIVIFIYHQLLIYLVVYVFFIFIISLIKIEINKKTINSIFLRLIPDYNFEWKSGMRKNFLLIIFVWTIGLLTSFYIASVPLAIFVIGVIIVSLYDKTESIQVLLASEVVAKKFLFKKILNHTKDFSILIVPLIVAFIIFNYEYYYISIIEFIAFLILLVYSILLKYSFYRPNEKSGASQTFSFFGILSLFVPFLLPVTLLLTVIFFFKANNNLKFYLNDFN